jgi:hypothetical protein
MNSLFSFTTTRFLMSLGMLLAFAAEGNPADVSGDLNYAQVTYIKAVQSDDATWCFHVTVRHNDGGWDHYANAWQVLDDHGNEIGLRTLVHPHDNEQPFTRSQCNITIPPGAKKVRVRARCTVHGYGGHEVVLDLSVAEGKQYRIIRRNK